MAKEIKRYLDLDLNFDIHPIKKDVSRLSGVDAVKRSLRNLIQLGKYERKFHPEIYSNVRQMLFENATPETEGLLRDLIAEVIEKHEPRCILKDIVVQYAPDENGLLVKIIFFVDNEADEQEFSTILERVR
jgi:phage baseplate assembly protein W